ncbi:MAG: sodium/solute symporter, partial [Planctomycetes bacterium]|nr:sodium/solute symporter [Planctomycetota bacterium]
ATMLSIGWIASRRQKDSEDFFLGGRNLPWWAAGVSIIAASFGGFSLISLTAFASERGQGLRWLQLQLGDLLGLAVVMVVFLPFFSNLRITTAYEYLERRFGVATRTVASALFIGQTMARAALLVYAPALAASEVLGWPLHWTILLTTVAAIFYSSSGGLLAVVWTDFVQMAVALFAVAYCLLVVTSDVPGGLPAILDHADAEGQLQAVTIAPDPGTPLNLVGALVPYAVLACSLFGTGQQAVQRFLACRDLRSARRAAISAWAVGAVAVSLTLFLGVCLGAWADLVPGASLPKGNRVLPSFIDARLPAGVAGLLIACVLGASMASLDAPIHSTSTAVLVDFVRRFARRPPDARRELFWARFAVVAFGLAAASGALYASTLAEGILDSLVRWLGYFAGPLLGLFLLGMLSRRANEAGALAGVAAAFALLAAGIRYGVPWGFHPLWLAPASAAATGGVGWAASLLWPPPDPLRLRGLVRGNPGPPD